MNKSEKTISFLNYTINEMENELNYIIKEIDYQSPYGIEVRTKMIGKLKEYLKIENNCNEKNNKCFEFYLGPFTVRLSLLVERTEKKEWVSKLQKKYIQKVKGLKIEEVFLSIGDDLEFLLNVNKKEMIPITSKQKLKNGVLEKRVWCYDFKINIRSRKKKLFNFISEDFIINYIKKNVCYENFFYIDSLADINYEILNSISDEKLGMLCIFDLEREKELEALYIFELNKEFIFNSIIKKQEFVFDTIKQWN